MQFDENETRRSSLSQSFHQGGITVQVEIYQMAWSGGWTVELVHTDGGWTTYGSLNLQPMKPPWPSSPLKLSGLAYAI